MVSNSNATGSTDQAFERTLKPRANVSLNMFAFLFSEIAQYMMKQEQAAQN